jgi:hypothetical protein
VSPTAACCRALWTDARVWRGLARVPRGQHRRTHLSCAARRGDAARARFLLVDANAPVDALDATGRSALHYAANYHAGVSTDVLDALLAAGATVDAAATRDAMTSDGGRYGAWATWRQGFGADVTADELCAAANGATVGSVDVLAQVRSLCDDNATTRATALVFTLVGAALTGTGVAVAALAGERSREETSAPRVVARVDARTQGVWLTVPF